MLNIMKRVQTQSGSVSIHLPTGLEINEMLFEGHNKEEAPYIFENLSIDQFNQGNFEQASLNTIDSIWNGNENYDFITELEDYNPGIVKKIKVIENSKDFKAVIR